MKTKQDIINNYAHDYLRGHFSKENITTSLMQMVREIEQLDQDPACNCGRNVIIKTLPRFEKIHEIHINYSSPQADHEIRINDLIRNQNKLIEIITSLQK